MKNKALAAFAAASIVISIQPGFARGHNHIQNISHAGEGLELGDFSALCCSNNSSGSVQTLHIPAQGFVVELTANGGSFFSETGVEHLDTNPVFLKKNISFSVAQGGITPSFIVFVDYTLNGGSQVERSFTVANGGLHVAGNAVNIFAGPGANQIPFGAKITGLFFDLEQDCGNFASGSEVMDISNVFLDKQFVSYEVDHGIIENESAFCSGGC
jgi:hypothetical protein